jgi:hypothetical protein
VRRSFATRYEVRFGGTSFAHEFIHEYVCRSLSVVVVLAYYYIDVNYLSYPPAKYLDFSIP